MKHKYILFVVCLAMLSVTSCSDKLDIEEHGVLSYNTFYKTDDDAESALTTIYSSMRGMEYNYKMLLNLLSDDCWAGGGSRTDNVDLNAINEYTFDTDQSFIKGCFQSYYRIVYATNVALAHIKGDTDTQKKMLAEAHVFRAWAYFELTTLWGNPPIVDHELESSEYSQPNASTEDLWKFIETDLTTAINSGCLSEKSGLSDNTCYRVTKQYAQALLGKAYVWEKKWSEAAATFDEVINSGLYGLYTGNYDDIFSYDNKNCCESMFEGNRVYDSNNVWDNYTMYALMVGPRTDRFKSFESDLYQQGWGFCCPQKGLYDAFVAEEGANGYRLNCSLRTYAQFKAQGNVMMSGKTLFGNESYFNWKGRIRAGEIPSKGYGYVYINNVRWMRYSEVLLLAAEANLEAGNHSKADNYLNQVRTRAKLSSKTNVTMDDIMTEKRLELCFECVRYQDLVRWGKAKQYLGTQGASEPTMDSDGKVTYASYNAAGKYGFQDRNNLLPYPATEFANNKSIKQNPGWGGNE